MNISDLKIHHIGVAVSDLDDAASVYRENGYICGEKIFDPEQNVNLIFAEKPDELVVELVQPAGENSPVTEILKKNGGEPEVYHVCYAVSDIEKALADFRKEKWLPLGKPVSARAFGGAKIVFLFSREAGLVELLEKKS